MEEMRASSMAEVRRRMRRARERRVRDVGIVLVVCVVMGVQREVVLSIAGVRVCVLLYM